MSTIVVNDKYLTQIADAIRYDLYKGTDTYKPREMAPAIYDAHVGIDYEIEDALLTGTATSFAHSGISVVKSDIFRGNPNLLSIALPTAIEIGAASFNGSHMQLHDVYLPNVRTIGESAFYSMCDNIQKLDLPRTTYIGDNAFYCMSSLNTVILRAPTVCEKGSDVFDHQNNSSTCPFEQGEGYLYVPRALYQDYINSDWRSELNLNQFRIIEDYPDICN